MSTEQPDRLVLRYARKQPEQMMTVPHAHAIAGIRSCLAALADTPPTTTSQMASLSGLTAERLAKLGTTPVARLRSGRRVLMVGLGHVPRSPRSVPDGSCPTGVAIYIAKSHG